MSDELARKSRARAILDEARNALANATASGAAAAIGGASATGIAISAGCGAVASTLAMAVGVARGWKEADAAKWWFNVLHGPDPSDEATAEEIAGLIDAHQDKPFVRETILRSVRMLYDAVDKRATLPLAVLAREYLRGQKAPDRLFRGAAGLLAETSAEEMDELAQLLDWVLAKTKRSRVILNALEQQQQEGESWLYVPWWFRIRRDDPGGEDHGDRTSKDPAAYLDSDFHPRDGDRLLFLLQNNGLARGHVTGGLRGSGAPQIEIERVVAERLAQLLHVR